jgi:hypothetical protein
MKPPVMPTILDGLHGNRATGTINFEVLVSPPFAQFNKPGCRSQQSPFKDTIGL